MKEEDRFKIASNAMQYLAEKDKFNAAHFEEEALKDPKVIERLTSLSRTTKTKNAIDEAFEIEPQVAKKVGGKFKPAIRLDSGEIIVSLTLSIVMVVNEEPMRNRLEVREVVLRRGDLMTLLQAIIGGIVQGLAEFLPISSSAYCFN